MEPIVIAGAGIGGLVAALALRQRGLPVRVLEQAPALREVGAGVQLSPNATRILAALGVLDAAVAVGVEPPGKAIRLWNTGQTWPLFDLGPGARAEYGHPYLMLHRADLQAVLGEALERAAPGSVAFGCRIAAVEPGDGAATLVLADGERVAAAMVIGADGVHSVVRSAVAPADGARFTGCMAWRGIAPAERLPERLRGGHGVNWIGPGRHVVTYPLRRGELVNFVGVVEGGTWTVESWTERGSRAECARDFAGWHPDVHALIDAVDTHYRWALLSRPTLARWSAGRVALLGDACHPMLPFMAQGAGMAMEDGFVLARAIEAAPDRPDHAFALYEAARVARANRCVEAAERNRRLFHDQQLAEASDAERYVSGQWSEAATRERYDWVFRYDATTVPLASGPAARSEDRP